MGRKVVAVGDVEHGILWVVARVLGRTRRSLTEEWVSEGVRRVLDEEPSLLPVVSRTVPEAREALGLGKPARQDDGAERRRGARR
jgi:hypothetical protein